MIERLGRTCATLSLVFLRVLILKQFRLSGDAATGLTGLIVAPFRFVNIKLWLIGGDTDERARQDIGRVKNKHTAL